jgi:hypothetical protein
VATVGIPAVAFEVDGIPPVFAARGERRDGPGRFDSGDGGHPGEHTVEEPVPVERVRVAVAGEGDVDGQHVIDVEAPLHAQQAGEAAGQQTRDDEQRRAQANLEADQALAQAHAAAALGGGAASGRERVLRLMARVAPGRQNTDQEPGDHGEAEGKGQHAGVQARLLEPGDVQRGGGHQQLERPAGQQQPEDAAGEGEHEALRQDLAELTGAAGPQGGADRCLSAA